MLWVAALLTLWTGFDYLKAAVRTRRSRTSGPRRCEVKLLYFAWVREQTGKAEETVELPLAY